MPSERTHTLLPHHERMLVEESGISTEVITERGYYSAVTKTEIREKGFGIGQQLPPALMIPIYGVNGTVVTYQLRPDEPRMANNGKPRKYETRARSRMVIDVPLRSRPLLNNPTIPLYITEGSKKADAGVTQGLCVIALLGVWNFRGRNEEGGTTALPDWESIALNERTVYIVFDSDVTQKLPVHRAMKRLKAFLESRGATVFVIYLPAGPGGIKTGLDDFFVRDGTVDTLQRHATSVLQQPPGGGCDGPYMMNEDGTFYRRLTLEGEPVDSRIANFSARIMRDVIEDDGAERRRTFEIEARLGREVRTLSVSAEHFASANWPLTGLGANAIVAHGLTMMNHLRSAIQLLSHPVEEHKVYTHTGWTTHNGESIYLHAGGGIGPNGHVPGIETRLEGALAGYRLPEPPSAEEVLHAVSCSLESRRILPDAISILLLGAIYRAPLGPVDFSVFISGPTGVGKSEAAAWVQQHFGSSMDSRHLPGSWSSTANALEGTAFAVKDAILAVDDFCPRGSPYDLQRAHRDADRLIRASGNGAARQRMRADATLRPPKPPRALLLSTGEDVPRGESLNARMLLLELSPGQMNWEGLGEYQTDARNGVFALAMSGYLRFLAGIYSTLRIREEANALRSEIVGQHKRTPEIAANLGLGIRYLLRFAEEIGALTASEAIAFWDHAWGVIRNVASGQGAHLGNSEPAQSFINLVRSALMDGSAHVSSQSGEAPSNAETWGYWTLDDGGLQPSLQPKGRRIGWVEGTNLFLIPAAAFDVAQRAGGSEGLTITQRTLHKRLWEQGFLCSRDESRNVYTVRRSWLGPHRENVLHLNAEKFLGIIEAASSIETHTSASDPTTPIQGGNAPDIEPDWVGADSIEAPARREQCRL